MCSEVGDKENAVFMMDMVVDKTAPAVISCEAAMTRGAPRNTFSMATIIYLANTILGKSKSARKQLAIYQVINIAASYIDRKDCTDASSLCTHRSMYQL